MKRGYSFGTVRDNIAALLHGGAPLHAAQAQAAAAARLDYFKRFPQGALPMWLAHSRGHRLAQHYDENGAPIVAGTRQNPAPRFNAVDVDRAESLAGRFTGRDPKPLKIIRRPHIPDALACIGRISVIQYIAERDGKTYEFRHPFRAASRPLLCVSPDGKTVLALGDGWTFTEDGFVDR